jgi:hypothetical protein
MTAVGTYQTRSDAELAQMVLWAAGIRYVVAAASGGAFPFDLTIGVRVLVEEPDAEDARAVLTDRPVTRKERP